MWRPRVLIAEDNYDLRLLYTFMLSGAGFEVSTADDGREALASLREARPDVLITDIQMPVMDGLELIRRVRDETELSDLPVLAISAMGDDYLQQALVAGATETINKPVEPHDLFDRVLLLLPKEGGH
jgi:CheY-like chemotaxis protein